MSAGRTTACGSSRSPTGAAVSVFVVQVVSRGGAGGQLQKLLYYSCSLRYLTTFVLITGQGVEALLAILRHAASILCVSWKAVTFATDEVSESRGSRGLYRRNLHTWGKDLGLPDDFTGSGSYEKNAGRHGIPRLGVAAVFVVPSQYMSTLPNI